MGIYGGGKPEILVASNEEDKAEIAKSRETPASAPVSDQASNAPEIGVAISDAVYGAISDSLIGSLTHVEVASPQDNKSSDSIPSAVSTKVNINSASKSELDGLPGVGAVLAENIISGRPYTTLDDLKKVPKLGDASIQRISTMIEF